MVSAGGGGEFAEVPWGAVFDPDINLRAVGAVQQRGFRAATDVVNRLVQMSAQAAESAAEFDATETAGEPGAEQRTFDSRTDAERLLRIWQRLASEIAGSLRAGAGAPAGSMNHEAQFDLATGRSHGELRFTAAEAGPVCGEIWLHNHGSEDLGKVRLRCSDLLSHDGSLVSSAGVVRFEPDAVAMPAKSSRGVTIEIDVDAGVRPGSYRGTLLAEGHEDVWLPVVLVVRAAV